MRALILVIGLPVILAGACSKQCVDSPGVCPPQLECVDGFRQTGAATCDDGEWVCGRVACAADAGSDSGKD